MIMAIRRHGLSAVPPYETQENAQRMSAMIVKLRTAVRSLLERGFFHIVIGNTLVKFISFCAAIFLPQIITPESRYGMLATVDNVNSYLILLNGIGLSNSVLRFCSMEDSSSVKSSIFRFCLRVGLLANGVMLLVYLPLLLSPVFSGGNYGAARLYILIACLIPTLTFAMDIALVFMRANLMNQVFSKISVVYTLLYAGFQILFALLFSLTGAFIGRYIALAATAALCIILLRRKGALLPESEPISRDLKIKILRYGLGTMVINSLSLIMPQNETLVVNLVLKDLTTTAYYKAASMIPSNLQYIATSVVVFIYPYFARHTGDGAWLRKNVLRVILGMMAIMIPVIGAGYLISPPLIHFVYGQAYAPALLIMRPMWIAFGINAILRVPLGNILAALGELRFNIILSAAMCVLHLGLDYYFISRMGIGGAAYALMIVYTIAGVASLVYLLYGCSRKWTGRSEPGM